MAKTAKKPAKKTGSKIAKSPKKTTTRKAKVSPIPKGLTPVTTMLSVANAASAIEFYKKAFGAREVSRMGSPDGKSVWHAELRIGAGVFMVADESPQSSMRSPSATNPPTGGIQLYVKDVDTTFAQAVKEGAKSVMAVADMFWGDRSGTVVDPAGVPWMISTRKVKMSASQMKKAGDEFMKNFTPPAAS